MYSVYPACFYKEENGYSVIFPDLNYLATSGETLENALSMAVDCLAGYLYWLDKDGEKRPAASAVSAVNAEELAKELDFEYSECFVNVITVDVAEFAKTHFEKSVRKNLTIPAWLNEMALRENINFSQVLQDALIKQLNISF